MVMLTLYKSLVRSLLEYCSPLWNPSKVSDIQQLESVQKTFTSRIAGCQDLDYWEKLQKLSLMSLQRRRERFIILTMWKILHGQTSNDLNIMFQTRPRTGTKAVVPSISRQSSASHQSRYNTSFAVMGPKLWNCVPNNLNTMVQFELFKKNLTEFLLSVPDTPPTKGYSPQIQTQSLPGGWIAVQLHCGAAKEVDDPAEFRQNLTQVTQVRLIVGGYTNYIT